MISNNPLVSIIIPVFNRASLVTATLDSILQQTYSNWECILVDDQSTDNSLEVLKKYQQKDSRFKVFSRSSTQKKGANACRNYGFVQSKGSFVKWFDSDDIMLTNHLEIAFSVLNDNNIDFVITDTLNFDNKTGEFVNKPYEFDKKSAIINAENYALSTIGWITDDFLAKREILVDTPFNENIITDGDEYNFFVRILNKYSNGLFIDIILTHRRIHAKTLSCVGLDGIDFFLKTLNIKFQTASDLVQFDNKKLIRWYLAGYMQYGFKLALNKEKVPHMKKAYKLIIKYYSFSNSFAFLTAIFAAKYLGRGYIMLKYART